MRGIRILKKSESIGEVFSPFLINEWIFDTKKSDFMLNMMSPEEKAIFLLDVT